MLAWISVVFAEDILVGATTLIVISVVSVPLNIPYAINELFLAYCFIKKFSMFGGILLFLIVDPAMFAFASILPRFLTKMMCEPVIYRLLISSMKILQALEETFSTHPL